GQVENAREQVERALKSNPRDPLGKYVKALVDFREGNLTAARETLQEVLRVAPNHGQTLLLFGVVNHGLGLYEQAVSSLTKVVKRYPRNGYARKMLAASLVQMDLPDQAADVIAPLLASGQQDPKLLTIQSQIHMRRGETDKAAEYLERAAQLDPDSASLHLSLGFGLLRTGETDRALNELQTAAELAPGQHQVDVAIILTHIKLGEYDQALDAIDALEREMPDSGAVDNLRAAVYLGKGDRKTARRHLEKALSSGSPSIGAAINLAQLEMKDGDVASARGRFELVLSWDENNLPAMLGLARLAAINKDEQQLVHWLNRAIKAHPTAMAPRELLARHHLAKREPQKALNLAREAYDADPDNPDTIELLGQVQLASGEPRSAVSTFHRLVQLRPRSPVGHYRVGIAELAAGNISAAADALGKAVDLKPHYLEAQSALVNVKLRQGRHQDALEIARQVQEQWPESPQGFLLEGEARIAQRQFPAAIEAFERALKIQEDSAAITGLHRALLGSGDAAGADMRLVRWLERRPEDSAVRAHLAQSYLLQGKNGKAVEQYEALLKSQPKDVRALNNLAWLYHFEQDERALATAEKAYQLAPENFLMQDTFGWLLVEAGEVERGLDLLQKAARTAPTDSEAHYHLAAALARSGETADARERLQALLSAGEERPWTADARALLRELAKE
ncbi:MAG TPA: PEP-CTERM system TPR-repeat protein PrsT, partial [Firmicutes bacterium]|nr:PEP-CTERM system TPR-repeat protein PrsT [Bacillota bacterium]